MLAMFGRIKSIFFPISSHKRKSNESIEILNENISHDNLSYQKCPISISQNNSSHSSVHKDIFQKNNGFNLIYKDTLPDTEKFNVKKIKIDAHPKKNNYINGDCKLVDNVFLKKNNEIIQPKYSFANNNNKKNFSNCAELTNLSMKSKAHLLDSKLIENLLRPSVNVETRQRRLQCLQAESNVNKEEIRKHEGIYMEDISECFRELCSIPPVVFPKISKKSVLPKITDKMKQIVDSSLLDVPSDFVLVEEFNLSVTVTDMISLRPRQWLTDNIINFYLELIYSRNNSSSQYPTVQILTTFFYSKLHSSGYNGIKRWTKKRPIFDCQLVLIPIHLGNHWCFVLMDMCNQEVLYYDSLKTPNPECLDLMKTLLIEDSKDKLKKPINIHEWKFKQIYNGPTQQNGYDCGVFLSQTAEYLSRRAKLDFKQDQMLYFREKMSYEIVTKQLL